MYHAGSLSKFRTRTHRVMLVVLLGLLGLALGACSAPETTTPMPTIIIPSPPCELPIGAKIPLTVTGIPDPKATYTWSASAGLVNPPSGPAITYTAPDQAVKVTIRVEATVDGVPVVSTLFCNVYDPSTPTPIPTNTLVPTATFTPTPEPTPTETPTPEPSSTFTPTPEPTPCCLTGWSTYRDSDASAITLSELSDTLEISYTIRPDDGFVVISREVVPELLAGAQGVRFYYDSAAEDNTLELKILYPSNTGPLGQSQTFAVIRPQQTGAGNYIEAFYSDFLCWVSSGCLSTDAVVLNQVWKFEIGIKNTSPEIHTGLITIYGLEFFR